MNGNMAVVEPGITKDRFVVIVSGLTLLIPASLGLLVSRVPTILCPFPALTVLPSFLLSSLYRAAVIIPPLIFCLWYPGLFRGEGKLPNRSCWLLFIAIVLSVIWFLVGWKDGLHYQGFRYVLAVAIANVVWIGILIAMFTRYRRHESSFIANLVFHWILFAWLGWYAFPYLGELP
jgi:hypothetical protein